MFVELVDAELRGEFNAWWSGTGSHLRARPGALSRCAASSAATRARERAGRWCARAPGARGRFAASCWERLAPLLEHPVFAVDLPGRGARASVDLATVGIEACVEAVVEDAGGWTTSSWSATPSPGWSCGRSHRPRRPVGPPRLRRRRRPLDGGCVFDTMSPSCTSPSWPTWWTASTGRGPSAASYLCNDMDDDATAFTLACRVAESVRLLAEPVDLTATRSVPCTYVRLTLDATLPLGAQDRAAAASVIPTSWTSQRAHGDDQRAGALARIIEGARSAT